MTNRRQLLQAGIAASALPLATPTLFAAAAAPADERGAARIEPYKILYDTRFPASVAFARRASHAGRAVVAFAGDVTRVWYDDLYHRWRKGPAAIAGLTSHGALFCLEQLAIDQRMRVVFRAAHSTATAGRTAHAIEGPASVVSAAVNAVALVDWAAAMADVVMQCPAAWGARSRADVSSVAEASTPASEPLYSWLIAPVRQARVVVS
jgi:hypothetical protein